MKRHQATTRINAPNNKAKVPIWGVEILFTPLPLPASLVRRPASLFQERENGTPEYPKFQPFAATPREKRSFDCGRATADKTNRLGHFNDWPKTLIQLRLETPRLQAVWSALRGWPKSIVFGRSQCLFIQKKMPMHNGVKIISETKGNGAEATRGCTVTIRYDLLLNRGDIVQKAQKETFTIGNRNTIAGLEYGVVGMQVGGKRTIRVSPHLAYRENGVPGVIPKNAVLVFEIELLAT